MIDTSDVQGMIVADISNPAVTGEILEEIWKWREEGCTVQDVIVRLRNRVIPIGYEYHNWHIGKEKVASTVQIMKLCMIVLISYQLIYSTMYMQGIRDQH